MTWFVLLIGYLIVGWGVQYFRGRTRMRRYDYYGSAASAERQRPGTSYSGRVYVPKKKFTPEFRFFLILFWLPYIGMLGFGKVLLRLPMQPVQLFYHRVFLGDTRPPEFWAHGYVSRKRKRTEAAQIESAPKEAGRQAAVPDGGTHLPVPPNGHEGATTKAALVQTDKLVGTGSSKN